MTHYRAKRCHVILNSIQDDMVGTVDGEIDATTATLAV